MKSDEAAKRLRAAYTLLAEPTTTREKFNHVSELIRGLHPRVDVALEHSHQALSTIDKIASGDIISLSAENLPENTEEEKRRKKYLLLFIKSWKDLQSEVARVSAEMNNQGQSAGQQATMWGRIFRGARGPLGVITVIAVGLVALQQTSVTIALKNDGCATLYPSGSLPPIPGISLPKDPIKNGDTASMTIPPLTLDVDGTHSGRLTLAALTYTFTFELPGSVSNVVLDGKNLLGSQSKVRLGDQKSHTLVLKCR